MKFASLTLVIGACICSATAAQAESCRDLSYERNAIFKQAGYCFKTAAQIRNFGNAGCRFDDERDLPLSLRDREAVASIVREERISGFR